MDASNSGFDEHLDDLHNGSDSSEAGVSIGDDGDHVVDFGILLFPLFVLLRPLLVLFAVVEQLSLDELVDFVRDSVHGVVCEVRARLVSARHVRGGALPTRDVNRGQVLAHVNCLHNVQSSVSLGARSLLEILP